MWTGSRLTRFAVLFVIDLATRRVEIAGVVPEPDGAWVIQCGRQITDPVEGILVGNATFCMIAIPCSPTRADLVLIQNFH